MKRFSILLMALATLISCDELQKYMNGKGEDDENSPDKGKIEFPDGANVQLDDQGGVFISSVSLNPAGPLNMKVGDHVEVYASYLPENATMTNLRWDKPDGTDTFDIVSNNPLQATIHAMRPGSATITVKAPTPDGQNNGPQATLDVTVTE